MLKKNFIIILIIILFVNLIGISYAETTSELREKQSDIESKISQTNSEIAGVKSKMTTTLNQINDLNADISEYQDQISDLETQISGLNNQIVEKESNIQTLQAQYDQQKAELDRKLVAMYEAGDDTYLDMLLSSKSFTDFLSNYYLISEIATYDKDMLRNIENTKSAIASEKVALEDTRNQAEVSKTSVEGKKNSLASSVSQKKNLVSNLSSEEAKLEEQLEEYEEDKKAIQRQIAAIMAKNSYSGKVVAPSEAGYATPLAGKTKSSITTGYGAYRGHTGVDFACSSGTPIHAVKSGVVVTSTALRSSSGRYRSYGEYVIIDHQDGTMTLYAHMSSRAVSKGQAVAQNDVIGYVGSTGNSTGPHLHFEVWVKGSRVNPTPYLP